MRKKHYKIIPIRDGEDTPCKECSYFIDNQYCSGNCMLIRRWKYIPKIKTLTIKGKMYELPYTQIKGYVYAKI